MAVSRLQTSGRILALISNANAKAPIRSGRKILSLEAGISFQQTTVNQQFHSTGSHIYHEPSAASMLKLQLLHTETAFQKFEESRQVHVYTDASARYGFGCVWGNEWVHGSWSKECLKQKRPCIEFLETYAMLVSMEVWAGQCRGRHVTIHCDNHSVVNRFNKKCKKENKAVQKLFTRMTDLARKHKLVLKVVKADTASDLHRVADGLSRGCLDTFLKFIPLAEATACKIPGHLDLVGRAYISQQSFTDKLPE